jgi:tRNA(Arg) A34 adenosine deaminase TadA
MPVTEADLRAAAQTLRQRNHHGPFWIKKEDPGQVRVKYIGTALQGLPESIQLVRALTPDELGISEDRGVAGGDETLLAINELVKFKRWPRPGRPITDYLGGGHAGGGPAVEVVTRKMPREIEFPCPDVAAPGVDVQHCHRSVHRIYMMFAFALLASRGQPDERKDQNIAALLVGADGKILGWAVNRKSKHPMLHAETTLVLDLFARRVSTMPRGTRVYTTLQSCRMCAAVMMATLPEVFAYYGQADRGNHAATTVLERGRREAVLPRDIMAWTKGQQGEGTRNLSDRLDEAWVGRKEEATSSFGKTAWAFLRSDDGIAEFDIAQRHLLAKVEQYLGHDAKPTQKPEVKAVLEHVLGFAAQLAGSPPFQERHPWVGRLKIAY